MTSFGPNVLPPIATKDLEDALPSMTEEALRDTVPPMTEEAIEDPVVKRLQRNKYYRTAMKNTSLKPLRRRVTQSRFTPDSKIDRKIQRLVKRADDNLLLLLESLCNKGKNIKHISPRKGATDRILLRESFTKMDNLEHWLRNKPLKSSMEEKYLGRCVVEHLKEYFLGFGGDSSCKSGYNHFMGNSEGSDKFLADETIGLHILDEYMLKNNVDLFQFLNALDKKNTGTLSWSRVAEALQKGKVPLKTYQIIQAMTALDCFEGGKMDIDDFCEKMFNFRQYKWDRLVNGNQKRSKNLLQSLKVFKDMKPRNVEIRIPAHTMPLDPKMFKTAPIVEDEPVDNRFWPGAFLDKLRICYMPEDGLDKYDRHHPLFEIIHKEKETGKPPRRLPPFSRYRIYGKDEEI